jgi:hypothetical protein
MDNAPNKFRWQSIRAKLVVLAGLPLLRAPMVPRFVATCTSLIRSLITKIPQHPTLYFVFQIMFLVWSFLWWRYPPAPGKAVLLLGVVAAIVTIQPQMTGIQRLVWLVVVFALFGVEYRAIDRDRYIHDKEQAEARTKETQNFQGIAGGIKQAIQESQKQFDATMNRSDQVMGLQVNALNGLSTNLSTLTGGDSFCYLAFVPGQQFLAFVHMGQFPLYGVSARIVELDSSNKAKQENLMGVTVAIGDMIQHHASVQTLSSGIGNAPDYFNANIFFTARNGDWTELLREQRIKDKWVRAMRVLGGFTYLRKQKVVCETIDREFPKQPNGDIDDGFRSLSGSKPPPCQ